MQCQGAFNYDTHKQCLCAFNYDAHMQCPSTYPRECVMRLTWVNRGTHFAIRGKFYVCVKTFKPVILRTVSTKNLWYRNKRTLVNESLEKHIMLYVCISKEVEKNNFILFLFHKSVVYHTFLSVTFNISKQIRVSVKISSLRKNIRQISILPNLF